MCEDLLHKNTTSNKVEGNMMTMMMHIKAEG